MDFGFRLVEPAIKAVSDLNSRSCLNAKLLKTFNPWRKRSEMDEWHLVGLLSSFPDISLDKIGGKVLPSCKTLSIPKPKNAGQSKTNRLSNLGNQVLVFKYKGFIHAIDNVC